MIPIVVPGYSVHTELQELVDAGLTPFEALAAGTRDPAIFLSDDAVGTVEVGKRADLVLLERNPLDNIANSTTIRGVCARGKWLDREVLDAQLNAIHK